MKRQYELMVLAKTDAFDVKKLLANGAIVKEVKNLGKKQLSYPIKKQTEGVYLLVNIEAESLAVGEIEKRVKLDENILRFLLTYGKQKLK